MAYAIGIDLGTSNSVVSVFRDGKPVVIADDEGNRTHPSVVSFGHGHSVVVGNQANRQMVYNPQGTVFSAKRLIGRDIRSAEVQRARELVPYSIVEGERNGQFFSGDLLAELSYGDLVLGGAVLVDRRCSASDCGDCEAKGQKDYEREGGGGGEGGG